MQLIGTDIAQALADGSLTSAKAVLNASGAIFFPSHEQHRDQRAPGLSYEDDYQGNALAAILDNCHIQVRYHEAYSEARVASVLTALAQHPNVRFLRDWRLTYQDRELPWSP